MVIDFEHKLSSDQLRAVKADFGHIRVIASAGSGKTRVLGYRYAYLRTVLHIRSEKIVCITFTKKAAREMYARICTLLNDRPKGFIGTFHSYGLKILREENNRIGWPNGFEILDENAQRKIILKIYEENDYSGRVLSIDDALSYISLKKATELDGYVALLDTLSSEKITDKIDAGTKLEDKIYYQYLQAERSSFFIDFDDMINIPIYLFHKYPDEMKTNWSANIEFLMVDEFQDVSDRDFEFCQLLSESNNNLFVVGDPDQLIYSWRNASMQYLMDFADGETIELNETYRCSPAIVTAANELIKNNTNRYEKEMNTKNAPEAPVHFFHALDQKQEASFVVSKVKEFLECHKEDQDKPNLLILNRTHDGLLPFEDALSEAHIPYTVINAKKFWSQPCIKHVIAYLKLINGKEQLIEPGDDFMPECVIEDYFETAIRHPGRKVGKKKLEKVYDRAGTEKCTLMESLKECLKDGTIKEHKTDSTLLHDFLNLIDECKGLVSSEASLFDILGRVTEKSGLEDELRIFGDEEQLSFLARLKQIVRNDEYDNGENITVQQFLDDVAVLTEGYDLEAEHRVQLMTIHSAKGLEAHTVFVTGLNEDCLPSKRADTLKKLEEERRLCYVAYTRAEHDLYLTEKATTQIDSDAKTNTVNNSPSRFIFEADYNAMDRISPLSEEQIKKANDIIQMKNSYIPELQPRTPTESEEYKEGEDYIHPIFGQVTIQHILDEDTAVILIKDKEKTVTIEGLSILEKE